MGPFWFGLGFIRDGWALEESSPFGFILSGSSSRAGDLSGWMDVWGRHNVSDFVRCLVFDWVVR